MKPIGLLLLAFALTFGTAMPASAINVDSLRREIIKNNKEIQQQKKDSLMLSKLSAEQLLELKRDEMEIERQRIENAGRSDMPFDGFQLFMIVMLPFLFVIVIIFLNLRARNTESKRRYDLYVKSIEMGQPVPEDFFNEPNKNSASSLKKGILWFAVGLGLLIFFLIDKEKDGMIFGIVPTFVGIGYLLVHYLDKPKTDTTVRNNEQLG